MRTSRNKNKNKNVKEGGVLAILWLKIATPRHTSSPKPSKKKTQQSKEDERGKWSVFLCCLLYDTYVFRLVRPEVISTFKNADGGTVTRTLVVKIDPSTEEISVVAEGRATVSVQRDYQQLQTFADMHGPCWFLIKHPGKCSWRIITYCPDSENV